MNKITVNHGTFLVDEIPLEHGTITIGRAKDNDVQLDDDAVSGHHAKIVTIFTASHVEDLGSTNGTFVNDKKVVEHTLHAGDIITLGTYQLVFYSDHGVAGKEPEKTMMMSSERLQAMIAEAVKEKKERAIPASNPQPRQQSQDTMTTPADKPLDNRNEPAKVNPSRPPVQAKPRLDVPAQVAEIRSDLQSSQAHGRSRPSLYIALAVTAIMVVAIAAYLLNT